MEDQFGTFVSQTFFLPKSGKVFVLQLSLKGSICPFKDLSSKVSNEKTPPAQGPVHHPESVALRIFSDRID